MKDHADMYNFLGPDIACEIPLETDRSEICIGHLRVFKSLMSVVPLSPTLLLVEFVN